MNILYHKVPDKWLMIGLHLEMLKENCMAGITEKYQRDPHRCVVEML